MRDLRVSGDQVWRVDLRVILGQPEVNSEVNLDPYLRNLIRNMKKAFIWP